MPDHRDKPASAMAHGSAKCSDIERVRKDVDEADARSIRAEETALEHHKERIATRVRAQKEDARV
jgi:hypothetical protein